MFAKPTLISIAAVGALIALPCWSQASAAVASQPPSTSKAATEAAPDATIATITRLARELKIAQLQRDLRDARKEKDAPAPRGSADAAPAVYTPATVASVPGRSARPAPGAKARDGNDQPDVVAIAGMGGALKAFLADGRELRPGTSVTTSTGKWQVKNVRAQAVEFEFCATSAPPSARKGRGKPEANNPPACSTVSVSPSA